MKRIHDFSALCGVKSVDDYLSMSSEAKKACDDAMDHYRAQRPDLYGEMSEEDAREWNVNFVKGWCQGQREAQVDAARALIANGMDVGLICEITGMTRGEIDELV